MKNLLYILCFSLAITSCKKDKLENEPKTITGRIVQDCTMVPLANSPIKLLISESQAFTGSDVSIYDFTSDANGNFSYTVDNPPVTFISELRFGGTTIKGVVPKSTNSKNLGELIARPTANFVVKLKINNSYGLGDTLSLANYDNLFQSIKIAAPFKDTVFLPNYNYSSPTSNNTLSNKNSVIIANGHEIFSGISGTSSFISKSINFDEVSIKGCSGAIDTVVKIIN